MLPIKELHHLGIYSFSRLEDLSRVSWYTEAWGLFFVSVSFEGPPLLILYIRSGDVSFINQNLHHAVAIGTSVNESGLEYRENYSLNVNYAKCVVVKAFK